MSEQFLKGTLAQYRLYKGGLEGREDSEGWEEGEGNIREKGGGGGCCAMGLGGQCKCTKFLGRRGSAPDPTGGAYSAPPDPLAGFRGRAPGKGVSSFLMAL